MHEITAYMDIYYIYTDYFKEFYLLMITLFFHIWTSQQQSLKKVYAILPCHWTAIMKISTVYNEISTCLHENLAHW